MAMVIKTLEDIEDFWSGDRLSRAQEALFLEKFVKDEIDAWAKQGREQSYVLAIDAPYGVGKTFFLDRFRRQLQAEHPVAYIDAWIDDANAEPLVAIMASIEEALRPFMSQRNEIRVKLAAVTRAALPIIGKGLVAAGATALAKHFGKEFMETAGDEVAKASYQLTSDAVNDGIDSIKDGIDTLIEREAQEMIDAYKKRRESRFEFKNRMRTLIEVIKESDFQLSSPLFIVVDELDRCRPDYAIRVLEEIKHFFDIPGVAFVVALHAEQLKNSISAIYGEKFDSGDYLRRFFSRRYKLYRPISIELVEEIMEYSQVNGINFSSPPIEDSGRVFQPGSAHEFTARFLDDYGATPREIIAAVDMLRVFLRYWTDARPVELPLLLGLIIHRLREADWRSRPLKSNGHLKFALREYPDPVDSRTFSADDLMSAYSNWIYADLAQARPEHQHQANAYYITNVLQDERAARNRPGGERETNSWLQRYPSLIDAIFPFALKE